MTNGGLLVAHEGNTPSRIDLDVLAGQLFINLTFVGNAFGDRDELVEFAVGGMKIILRRGKFLILAARVRGKGNGELSRCLVDCIRGIEREFAPVIEDWDGSEALERSLAPRLRMLLGQGYLNADRVGPRREVDPQLLGEARRERRPAGLEELGLADEQSASIQVDVANREPEDLTYAKPSRV